MSIDRGLLDEARSLGINVSRAAEAGLTQALQQERARRWKADNSGAIADYNAMIENTGVPLADYRKF